MAIYSDSWLLDLLAAGAACALALFALLSFLQSRWTRKGIPFHNVHPLFGNIKDVVLGRKILKDVLLDFYLEHRHKPFIAFFSFTQPMVMVNDMEMVKNVLISDFSAFTDRNFDATPSDPMECHNLFTLKGQAWRQLRLKLTPTFTSGKMKKMFEYVDACGKGLAMCIEKEVGEKGDLEMKEFCGRFTTDVIATCAFGIEGNSLQDPDSLFRHMLKRATTPDFLQNVKNFLMFVFPWLVEKLNLTVTETEVLEFLRATVWSTVEYREKHKVSRNDFLELLMQIRKNGRLKDDEAIDDDDEVVEQTNEKMDLDGDKFVAQCFLFLVAGYETSSSAMSSALYEMAINPDIQTRVYEEIQSVLADHNGEVTYEAVQEMTYLHMVLQETIRKYPVLLFLDRRVNRPYRLPGTAIELSPGDSVMVPLVGIHNDPDLYPEPHRFDPERFSEEQKRARPPCSFLGFGDGPRNCIGMRMGYMQSKVGLIYTLLKYEVSPAPKTKIPLTFNNGVFVQVEGGIPLRLRKRDLLLTQD